MSKTEHLGRGIKFNAPTSTMFGSFDRRRFLEGLGLGAIATGLGTKGYSGKPKEESNFEGVTEVSYIIFTDGKTVYVKNGKTGKIDYRGKDAATLIQRAIDGLDVSGGRILVKEGRYSIGSALRIPSNVALIGSGTATALQLRDGIILKNASGVTLASVALSGASGNNIDIRQSQKVKIEFVTSLNAGLHGLNLTDCKDCLIHHYRAIGNRWDGLVLENTSNCEVASVICSGSIKGTGVTLTTNSKGNLLMGIAAFENRDQGIVITTNSSENIITSALSYTNGKNGICIYNSSDNVIIAAVSRDNGQMENEDGINIAADNQATPSINNIVTSCRCFDSQTKKTQRYGISEWGFSDYNLVYGNNCRGNAKAGISYGGKNSKVWNNLE